MGGNWRNQAFSPACAVYSPETQSISVMAILQQLRFCTDLLHFRQQGATKLDGQRTDPLDCLVLGFEQVGDFEAEFSHLICAAGDYNPAGHTRSNHIVKAKTSSRTTLRFYSGLTESGTQGSSVCGYAASASFTR